MCSVMPELINASLKCELCTIITNFIIVSIITIINNNNNNNNYNLLFPYKVAHTEPEESKSPDEEVGGMAGALARALEMRSNAIHGDSGKEWYMYIIHVHVHCICTL